MEKNLHLLHGIPQASEKKDIEDEGGDEGEEDEEDQGV